MGESEVLPQGGAGVYHQRLFQPA